MTRTADMVVLGGGIVGVCVALHLQLRGRQTVLVDRKDPGAGTSYGNAGLIQNEAVMPHLFPRAFTELLRYARNRSIDAAYDSTALPAFAAPFFRYWRNSRHDRALAIAHQRAPLIRRSVTDHLELAEAAGALDLLRPIGWTKVFYSQQRLDRAIAEAEAQLLNLGVSFRPLDSVALADHEGCLSTKLVGGLHWPDPISISDPYALTRAYLDLFLCSGGSLLKGDALSLEEASGGWAIETESGPLRSHEVAMTLGPWSPELYGKLGYSLPFFVMRGYHRHYSVEDGARLTHPVLDAENGFFLVPMRQGIRLTTGAEFTRRDAPPNPAQLERALPKARELFPGLGQVLDPEPWMGARPCMPDMLPVIGPAPRHRGLWFAFGHGHHGLTLGPTTGKLLADLVIGAAPFTDPAPYRADRFDRRARHINGGGRS